MSEPAQCRMYRENAGAVVPAAASAFFYIVVIPLPRAEWLSGIGGWKPTELKSCINRSSSGIIRVKSVSEMSIICFQMG